jgi:hypothetical protein
MKPKLISVKPGSIPDNHRITAHGKLNRDEAGNGEKPLLAPAR